MEKQIVEILINHFGWQRKESCDKSAKEIADIFRKYDRWKAENAAIIFVRNNKEWFGYACLGEYYTPNELFNYWWNEIKNK